MSDSGTAAVFNRNGIRRRCRNKEGALTGNLVILTQTQKEESLPRRKKEEKKDGIC